MPKVQPPLIAGHSNWHEKHRESMSLSDRIADRVTNFAGTMHFVYTHFIWWAFWFSLNSIFKPFDKYPYSLLTMILSLEAILLATLIMISQNRQSARDKVQAEHQYEHQEQELKFNTEITKEIHELVKGSGLRQKRDSNGRFTKG